MLTSMTGFGKGEAENKKGRVCVEIKSLNHKYFDMISKLPFGFHVFEDKIKARIQRKAGRGRISVLLEYDDFGEKNGIAHIDIAAARKYAGLLRNMKKKLNLSGGVTIQQIISMPGVIAHSPQKVRTEHLWPLIEKALDRAMGQLLKSKEDEGAILKKQFLQLCKGIEDSIRLIKRYSANLKKSYHNRLTAKIKSITGTRKIYDRAKIEEEIAIFVRNSDVAEEICRIGAHITSFKTAVSDHKGIGRKLDFIAQELSREANTIGAKANDFRIAKETIKIKGLVEKIREQTQNVE